jgi:hypothetical protein
MRAATRQRPAWGRASLGAGLLLAGCQSELSNVELVDLTEQAAEAARSWNGAHDGPPVAPLDGGPARFVPLVWAAIVPAEALAVAQFADRWYRAEANEGFDATLAEVERRLREAGYGRVDGLELEVIETPRSAPAWTPRRARLALRTSAGEEVLHAFDAPEGRDRTLLPVNAPSAELEARLVLSPEQAGPGTAVLLSGAFSRAELERLRERGAALAIAADLFEFNVDPSPAQRHRDAIAYRTLRHPAPLPVAQVSPRSAERLRAAAAAGEARVVFQAEVEFAERPLRTLVATVVGTREPARAVPIAAHVQEPGACDNASGVGTATECARALAQLVSGGTLTWPARSVAFVFGDEMEQSRVWLERSRRSAIVALAADMTGASRERTGAKTLLERTPDPGALRPLPPDRHTAWGAEPVEEGRIVPDGLAVVMRCALLDVGRLSEGWSTGEHPYEGGSDHVVFLRSGVPATLVWRFPDWAYHTGADRMENVDAEEMRRSGAVLLATALSIADAEPRDLERYLRSSQLEIDLRTAKAREAGDTDLEQRWKDWGQGARQWLRVLCLGSGAALPAKDGAPAARTGG